MANTSLKIAYAKLGLLRGTTQMIVYDSTRSSLALTKILTSLTAEVLQKMTKTRSGQTQSQMHFKKKVSYTDREKIAQIITRNGFFQMDVFYSPDSTRPQDYTLMVLSVSLEGKLHTVTWTDISRNVPRGLNSIVEAIQDVASK